MAVTQERPAIPRNLLAILLRDSARMLGKALFGAVSRGFLHPWFRASRNLTLGVRCMVIDDAQNVLLVRHSYAPGWLFAGGGVERGETVYDAVTRELREETGIVAEEIPRLHGLFSNEKNFKGDHVACFVVRRFRREPWRPSLEIVAADFFPAARLPEGTTGGTRRRLDEVLGGHPVPPAW